MEGPVAGGALTRRAGPGLSPLLCAELGA